MEFVFDFVSKFVPYEYGNSRTNSMFVLPSLCKNVECVPSVHFARRFLVFQPGEYNIAVLFRGPVVCFVYP